MHLDLLHHRPAPRSAIHRLNPAAKIVALVAFLAVVAATPPSARATVVFEALVVVAFYAACRISMATLARRLLKAVPAVALFALAAPASHGFADGWERMWEILTKSLLAIAATLLLISVTPPHDIFAGLRQLRMPRLFVAVLALMIRYLTVMLDEWQRMHRAKLSRTFRRREFADWFVVPNLVGRLLIRAIERGERVHQAMLARNWNGEFHTFR
jgi:cobalt/nickel transport system permease protein